MRGGRRTTAIDRLGPLHPALRRPLSGGHGAQQGSRCCTGSSTDSPVVWVEAEEDEGWQVDRSPLTHPPRDAGVVAWSRRPALRHWRNGGGGAEGGQCASGVQRTQRGSLETPFLALRGRLSPHPLCSAAASWACAHPPTSLSLYRTAGPRCALDAETVEAGEACTRCCPCEVGAARRRCQQSGGGGAGGAATLAQRPRCTPSPTRCPALPHTPPPGCYALTDGSASAPPPSFHLRCAPLPANHHPL